MTETAKSLDTATQQARSAFDMSVKSLNDSLSAKTKDLMDELKSDKKYAPKLKEIETIQQQQKDAISEAQKKFNASAGPLQQKVATDQALIDGLVPVVRKESGLPPTAKFDAKTQEWSTK